MTAAAVEITPRDEAIGREPVTAARPAPGTTEPAGFVIVNDVDALTSGSVQGCGDDNPYR